MPRISATSGAPDLTVEPKLIPEDISKMTDEELDAAIDRLQGDRSMYVARVAKRTTSGPSGSSKNAPKKDEDELDF